jgi:hypothetical protein
VTPDFRRYYGCEFVGDWLRKTDSEFTKTIENVARRNSGKEHRTLWELIREREPERHGDLRAVTRVLG